MDLHKTVSSVLLYFLLFTMLNEGTFFLHTISNGMYEKADRYPEF
jgi:hypothetical protein